MKTGSELKALGYRCTLNFCQDCDKDCRLWRKIVIISSEKVKKLTHHQLCGKDKEVEMDRIQEGKSQKAIDREIWYKQNMKGIRRSPLEKTYLKRIT